MHPPAARAAPGGVGCAPARDALALEALSRQEFHVLVRSRQSMRRTELLRQQVSELAEGQILALGARTAGANGEFAAGDVGHGEILSDGNWVLITWPNGTQTKTVWPNVSWYAGRPRGAPAGDGRAAAESPTARRAAAAFPMT
ncbi:unnamed protein product [Prorocentrum cordatum]|uniref:Uncharacterized protein n=1 Tax=Prorocentrum cordatum TaxID=2364126 RepID=A0ABN9Y6K7_9DINO|nr:unnamed protein product [Polarella glacialis]